jgi:hypothetical protein
MDCVPLLLVSSSYDANWGFGVLEWLTEASHNVCVSSRRACADGCHPAACTAAAALRLTRLLQPAVWCKSSGCCLRHESVMLEACKPLRTVTPVRFDKLLSDSRRVVCACYIVAGLTARCRWCTMLQPNTLHACQAYFGTEPAVDGYRPAGGCAYIMWHM